MYKMFVIVYKTVLWAYTCSLLSQDKVIHSSGQVVSFISQTFD